VHRQPTVISVFITPGLARHCYSLFQMASWPANCKIKMNDCLLPPAQGWQAAWEVNVDIDQNLFLNLL
jgi:hypothetical protein